MSMSKRKWIFALFAIILIALAIYFATRSYVYHLGYEAGYDNCYESAYNSGYNLGKQTADTAYGKGYSDGLIDGSEGAEHDYMKIIDSQGDELGKYEDISYCVVFVTNDGKYHHFTCDKLGEDFWENYDETAFDMRHAKNCGYVPCSECIPDYIN